MNEKSCSQPVNFPGAQPFNEPPDIDQGISQVENTTEVFFCKKQYFSLWICKFWLDIKPSHLTLNKA